MRRYLSSLTFAVALFVAPLTVYAAADVGVVGSLEGSASAIGASGTTRALKAGDAVYIDEEIATGAGSKLQLMFKDKSSVMLNANSHLKVREFSYNPESNDGKLAMQEIKGAFRFIGGALSKKKPITIQTPVSSIGIRGGVGDTFIDASGATESVFIYGEAMTMTNADGQTVTVTDFGSGLAMQTPNDVPTPMTSEQVQQRLNTFAAAAPQTETAASGDASESDESETADAANSTAGGDDSSGDEQAQSDSSDTASSSDSSDSTTSASTASTGSDTATNPTTSPTTTQPLANLPGDVNTINRQVTNGTTSQTAANTATGPVLKGIVVNKSGSSSNILTEIETITGTRSTASAGGAIFTGQSTDIYPTAGTPENGFMPAPPANSTGFFNYTPNAGDSIFVDGGGTAYTGFAFTTNSGGTTYQQFDEKNPTGSFGKQKTVIIGNKVEGITQVNNAIAATNALSNSQGSGNISYYRFAPNLSNGSTSNNGLGFYDYGHLDVNPTTTTDNGRASPLGMAVNWQKNQFISGAIDWNNNPATPTRDAVIAFGHVNPNNGQPVFIGQGYSDAQANTIGSGPMGTANIGGDTYLFRNPGAGGEIEALSFTTHATDQAGNLIGNPIYQPAIRVNPTGDPRLAGIDANSRGSTAAPVTEYVGFSAGMQVLDDGNNATPHQVRVLQSGDINDVKIVTNNTTNKVGAQIKLANMSDPSPSRDTVRYSFGENPTADKGDSVYLSNDLYAAQAARTEHLSTINGNEVISGTTNNTGFIANASAINTLSAAQQCTQCDYVHWGVWSVDARSATAGPNGPMIDNTNMMPYVAGAVTQTANIPSNVSGTTSVNYTGPIYGQMYNASANTLERQTGSFTAGLDLGTRQLTSFSGTMGGYTMTGSGPVNIRTAGTTAVFDPMALSMNDGSHFLNGSINSALFGPAAENIGGNFEAHNTGRDLNAAGVFLGAR